MQKEVNLEEILKSELKLLSISVARLEMAAIRAMKEACRQTLELAAENAIIIDDLPPYEILQHPKGYKVDLQSILNTINQVK